jgi:rubrerythrin
MIRFTPPRREGNSAESPALVREIYRALGEELAAVVGYSHAHTLLEGELPYVAELFSEISMDEMRHYHTLSGLLRDLGAPFSPRQGVFPVPPAPTGDAISTARQLLSVNEREERQAHQNYLRMASHATLPHTAQLLRAIAVDEEEHAAALSAMQHRLRDS